MEAWLPWNLHPLQVKKKNTPAELRPPHISLPQSSPWKDEQPHMHKNSSNTCISLRCSELRGINTTMWSALQTEWIPKVCSHRAAYPLHPQHLLQSLCVCAVQTVEAGIQSAAAAAQSACDSEAGLWSCELHRAPLLCLPPPSSPNGGQRTIIGWRTSLQTVKGVTVIP